MTPDKFIQLTKKLPSGGSLSLSEGYSCYKLELHKKFEDCSPLEGSEDEYVIRFSYVRDCEVPLRIEVVHTRGDDVTNAEIFSTETSEEKMLEDYLTALMKVGGDKVRLDMVGDPPPEVYGHFVKDLELFQAMAKKRNRPPATNQDLVDEFHEIVNIFELKGGEYSYGRYDKKGYKVPFTYEVKFKAGVGNKHSVRIECDPNGDQPPLRNLRVYFKNWLIYDNHLSQGHEELRKQAYLARGILKAFLQRRFIVGLCDEDVSPETKEAFQESFYALLFQEFPIGV